MQCNAMTCTVYCIVGFTDEWYILCCCSVHFGNAISQIRACHQHTYQLQLGVNNLSSLCSTMSFIFLHWTVMHCWVLSSHCHAFPRVAAVNSATQCSGSLEVHFGNAFPRLVPAATTPIKEASITCDFLSHSNRSCLSFLFHLHPSIYCLNFISQISHQTSKQMIVRNSDSVCECVTKLLHKHFIL